MSNHFHSHSSTEQCCCSASSPFSQSLSEIDFEKGLWIPSRDGNLSKVREKLLKNPNSTNQVDSSGFTPLHYASRSGHLEVCQLLISYGALINIQTTGTQITPLHRASFCGHVPIVRLLLDNGGNPNIQDSDGETPLHKAVKQKHINVVRELLKSFNIDCTCVDKKQMKAIDYNESQEIFQIFSEHQK